MTPSQPQIFDNHDVVLRLMELLGPCHVCTGIGATCRDIRQLSKSDSIWRIFWRARCLSKNDGDIYPINRSDDDFEVHKAAFIFRHAIHVMNLTDKVCAAANMQTKKNEETFSESNDGSALYFAYIQTHSMMNMTNLRVEPFGHRLEYRQLEQFNLRSPLCTQTWPGQLSLVADENVEGNTTMRNRVICHNSAEAWCDAPTCDLARCGPQGCRRSYRFLPRDYSLSVGGQIMANNRECSDRNYDMISFVKCSWCSVSFCNEHVLGHDGREMWYTCDECKLSSCPDCVSQVFLSPPDMEGCKVITGGKLCRRSICTKCIWYVGKKKQSSVGNIPGGNDAQNGDADIITIKGDALIHENGLEWEDVETSCSKCLRHVEFRWKELAQVQESFGGFMP
mmetsp:Transcript_11163/g.27440  ORF Transcript_11163/g.27440 Transcript_11163/m.27440 type:complete len:394 (+) Transcript_11163:61-1242(+)